MDLRGQYRAHGNARAGDGSPTQGGRYEGRYQTEGGIIAPPPTTTRGRDGRREIQPKIHRRRSFESSPSSDDDRKRFLKHIDNAEDHFSSIGGKLNHIISMLSKVKASPQGSSQVSPGDFTDGDVGFLTPADQRAYIDRKLEVMTESLQQQVIDARAEADASKRHEHEAVHKNNSQAARGAAREIERLRENLEQEMAYRVEVEQRLKAQEKNLKSVLRERDQALKRILEVQGHDQDPSGEWEAQFNDAQARIEELEAQVQSNGQNEELETQLDDAQARIEELEAQIQANDQDEAWEAQLNEAQARIEELEAQVQDYASLEQRVQELQRDKEQIEDTMSRELAQEQARTERVEDRRRILFDQVQELKGSIRVFCRIRPPPGDASPEELLDFGEPDPGELGGDEWGRLNLSTIRKAARGDMTEVRSFDFERVFGQDAKNGDIFNQITDLAQSAVEGKKVCIFCYGQTGSGKTHTMLGTDEEPGLIPQTMNLLFGVAAEQELDYQYTIELCITEIYQDTIHDLLLPPTGGKKKSVRMSEATQARAESVAEALDMLKQASKHRTVAATNANEQSSRSHLVLALRITRVPQENVAGRTTVGTLNLIDLAGSERAAAAGASGTQMKEGVAINSDLMNLNRVITALGTGTRVPYDSALTRTLRDSLTQGSRTLMLVMVSPYRKDQAQTIQTLNKGAEATKAKLASQNQSTQRPGSSLPTTSTTATPARPTASGTPRSGPAPRSATGTGPASGARGTTARRPSQSATPSSSRLTTPRSAANLRSPVSNTRASSSAFSSRRPSMEKKE